VQWIAQLGFARDSWTAPLHARRLLPSENAASVAAEQVKALHRRLSPTSTAPLFVFDAGYDVTARTHALRDKPVALLVRLRADRCFYAVAPAVAGPRNGRPRRNGAKFRCDDPATWPMSATEHTCEDAQYGAVTVQAGADLHTVVCSPRGERTYGPQPHVTGTVMRVTVTRHAGRARGALALWRWWQGPGAPDLDVLWRASLRRYDIAQLFRFLKQTLNWTTPQIRTPVQADRWTWLLLVAYTQLRLACPAVAAAALAAATDADAPHAGASAAGFFDPAAGGRHAGGRAKTLRALAGTAAREALGSGTALSRRQEGGLTARDASIRGIQHCG